MREIIPTVPGTYILLLRLAQSQTVTVGRLGEFRLSGGLYAYVGSAQGPGGLRARVGRHLRQDKTLRWHIDALTTTAVVDSVWYDTSSLRLECTWAEALAQTPGITRPIPGFGSSDCDCLAHLFYIPAPLIEQVWQVLDQPLVYEPK